MNLNCVWEAPSPRLGRPELRCPRTALEHARPRKDRWNVSNEIRKLDRKTVARRRTIPEMRATGSRLGTRGNRGNGGGKGLTRISVASVTSCAMAPKSRVSGVEQKDAKETKDDALGAPGLYGLLFGFRG
jgi:hypothetical protein